MIGRCELWGGENEQVWVQVHTAEQVVKRETSVNCVVEQGRCRDRGGRVVESLVGV